MSTQRIIRMTLSVLASLASLALSWPYWRDFGYWAESRSMWLLYFALGFVLAVYVFNAFFDSLSTLFEHDALEREARTLSPQTLSSDETPASGRDAS